MRADPERRPQSALRPISTSSPRRRPRSARRSRARSSRPLKTALADLKDLLTAHTITLEQLPHDIVEQWKTPDGQTRVEALPKGDPNDNETLRTFARAVLAVAAGRDRRADLDPGIRPHDRARVLRGGRLGADLDRDPAVDRAEALRRRAADAGSAAARRCGDARALRRARHARSISPTSSRCRCCSASASRSRSTTSWHGARVRPTCCNRA